MELAVADITSLQERNDASKQLRKKYSNPFILTRLLYKPFFAFVLDCSMHFPCMLLLLLPTCLLLQYSMCSSIIYYKEVQKSRSSYSSILLLLLSLSKKNQFVLYKSNKMFRMSEFESKSDSKR